MYLKPTAQSSETLASFVSATQTPPQITHTPQLSPSPRLTEVKTRPVEATDVQFTPVPCDQAAPGHPIDVSIPDNTAIKAGKQFTKIWRLVNTGSCTWTSEYSVVWFSGADMGLMRVQRFTKPVEPGKSVDLAVDMVAPQSAGVYQSNWKISNPQKQLFGIGPSADAPFWVRIEVKGDALPTEAPTASVTAPPVVVSNREVTVSLDESVDLDHGLINSGSDDDLRLEMTNEGLYQIVPLNRMQVVLVGASRPEQVDCLSAPLSAQTIMLDGIADGSYICYRTSQGLPGFLRLSLVSLAQNSLTLEYLTWAMP